MSAAMLGTLAAQSTLGAALGLGGLWLLRRNSPLDRAVWLKLALGLLLAMPLLPRVSVPMPDALARMMAPSPSHGAQAPIAMPRQAQAIRPASQPSPALSTLALPTLALTAYGVGVAGLLGHLLLGLGLLRRWTRRALPLRDAPWQRALAASGAPAATRLLVSDRIKAPLSWGLRHPVILIDPASARRPGDAPAILAHEAAHIARADWLALMGARVATALFWFNPLVWVLARALVQHCEEAADARALIRCAPADYAETLMTCLAGCAAARSSLPANGMAAGHGLSRRVHQVLDAAPGALLARSRGAVAGLTGVAVLAVAGSLVSFAHAADPVRRAQSTRIVHPDGTVETRQRAANGDTTIEVVGADGHHTSIHVDASHGHHVSVASYGPGDTVPPPPPVPPVAAVTAAPPAPPVPPAPPLAALDDEEDGIPTRAELARIRADALREARQARTEALVQAAAERAEAERERVDALAIARQARREALAMAGQIRAEAMASAREALASAHYSRHAAATNDDD